MNTGDTATTDPLQRGTPDENRQTLIYWLAMEDVYTSSFVRKWLDRTPRDEATAILGEIAQDAQPEPRSVWHLVFHGLTMIFSASETVTKNSPAGRKTGVRAALLLANMGEPSGVRPLMRVFQPGGFWEGKYQQAIEEALLNVLTNLQDTAAIEPFAPELRQLAERIWLTGNPRRDLSERLCDLLLTLQRLARQGGEESLTLLRAIANGPAWSPRRGRIKTAAVALLSDHPSPLPA